MKFQAPLSHGDYVKLLRWKLVKLTGWTMDYVDSLNMGLFYELLQIEDGLAKAR